MAEHRERNEAYAMRVAKRFPMTRSHSDDEAHAVIAEAQSKRIEAETMAAKIDALEANLEAMGDSRCSGLAFVTFLDVADAEAVHHAYKSTGISYRALGFNCCLKTWETSKCLKNWCLSGFNNDFNAFGRFLRAQYPAPEPGDVVWHHLSFRRHQSSLNQILNFLLSAGLIGSLTFFAVLSARNPNAYTSFISAVAIAIVKLIILGLFNVTTRMEKHWTMSELEASLGVKIALSQITMTFTVALAGDAISYNTGTCSWYNVGMIFVYNAGLMAFLQPFLEFIRLVDWGVANPWFRWICCFDVTSDADQMYPAYMLSLYAWFVRLVYMLALCVTFGGVFSVMYWFALLECFLCYKVDRFNMLHVYAVCAKYDTRICRLLIGMMPIILMGNGITCGIMMLSWESQHQSTWPYYVGYGVSIAIILMGLITLWMFLNDDDEELTEAAQNATIDLRASRLDLAMDAGEEGLQGDSPSNSYPLLPYMDI